MSKDYGSWTLPALKNELRKRNAKTTGKKAILVQRLQDYDSLFGPLLTEPDTVFRINIPSPEYFRDITTDTQIPALEIDDMHLFCRLTERDDIAKSKNMYDEKFLLSCRLAEVQGEYYITGVVASEMRKNIIYNVTLKLKHHLILETQCECAAGMGPYAQCKHILVVIYGLIDCNQNNKIKIRETVTQSLQTFHQPQVQYSGYPIKADDFVLKLKTTKLSTIAHFDPRPKVEPVIEFNERFKNAVANYCGQNSDKTMPITQIIKPADKESIFKDHDYLEKTAEEEFLETLKLTEEQIKKLEEDTRTNKKKWEKERLYRIHSSNFGTVCKIKNDGGRKLAESFIKNKDTLTLPMKHGIKYEDEAIRKFESMTKIKTEKCGIVVHKVHQFIASTPDRLVGENAVLEVKCPFTAKGKTVSPETVPYINLCEVTGHLKLNENHNYYYQVQGQLLCTQRDVCYFCVYTLSDFTVIKIRRDDKFIVKMYQKLENFYSQHFENVLIKKILYNKK